jgi:hypothetical protein
MGKKLNQLINKKKDKKLISSMKSRIEKKKARRCYVRIIFYKRNIRLHAHRENCTITSATLDFLELIYYESLRNDDTVFS